MSGFGPVFHSLDEAGARYVLVGGLAVVLHGYARLTADIDLVVDLSAGEPIKVVAALDRIGFVPRAPVAARDFADPARRLEWIESKGMRVFSMHDPRRPLVEVDLFIDPPIAFTDLAARAVPMKLAGHLVQVASLDDLIAMKRLAGRPKDLEDIEALSAIRSRERP